MPRQTYRLRDYQTTSFERSLAGFALPPDSPMLPLLPSALIVLAMALLFSRFRRSTGFRAVFDLLNACVIAVLLNSAIHLIVSALGLGGTVDWAALLIFAVSFWLLFRCKINPLYVMAGSGLPGLIFCSVWP